MFARMLYVQLRLYSFLIITFMYFNRVNSNQKKYITLDFDKCIVFKLDKHKYCYNDFGLVIIYILSTQNRI